MFTPQNIYYKNTIRIAFIYLVFEIVLIILLIVINVLSSRFKKLDEIKPIEIDITGIKSFNFSNSETMPYVPGIPNLGNTSKVTLSCYRGWCQKRRRRYSYYSYSNENSHNLYFNDFSSKKKEFNSENDNNSIKKKIISFYEDDDDLNEYSDYLNFNCARECFFKQEQYCNLCPRQYESSEGKCQYMSNDNYNSEKFCLANYLILKWKGLSYSSTNATTYKRYSYIKSAILPNESCPSNTKLCGFLDDYGNKLCISQSEICPINKIIISDITPRDGYHYNYININNMSIYYTNEAIETGKIIEGFFVDSDYFIQYKNGCDIIDEGTIEELIKDNRNIYPNYKKKANIIKSYLKICYHDHDKKINLIELRKKSEIYNRNIDLNENINNKIKNFNFLIGFLGYFSLIFFGLILILIIHPVITKKEDKDPITIKFFCGCLAVFLVFGGITIFGSVSYNSELKDFEYKIRENEDIYNWNTYSALIVINKIFHIIFIIYMIIVFICVVVYIILYFNNKYSNNYNRF